ncbi:MULTISPECIES: aspartate kinase [Psychrilyobacter]|uniref:Aspartokinase n=1 Tax=Psychrilyobacter piezotolerans TaxID=2293438 RepID=A0ABX9KHA6_9FUSO|nr:MULTISPECIES: aspartate kinase [Psychrilyobacter]MCS5420658.1 aspartate kinase [Psychrilyobacter sp. S5]NDI77832.1 aspartate kinase [Psychrilyobacter piezotolerans]RDE62314.1 aspartate kinase [Psychrilyobacter sp. S5]REI41412.1 aspartate kinase [Psychrilyobacter piezotolerans]
MIVVQKFGGTSLKGSERLREVAKWVVKNKNEGNKMVVIVSAPGGMTDSLINEAKEMNTNPKGRELDMLLSVGEQISAALLAMGIEELGEKAVSFNASQLQLKTNGEHNNAKILNISPEKILENLNNDYIVIVTGFQGVDDEGNITTLGRGGSDTSAVAIGAAVNANKIEIYTDVDGVYTSDPRIIKNAKKIKNISFDEMIEMADKGSKVLHCRSVELASKYEIPIHLRSAFSWREGTWIKKEKTMENSVVRGISNINNLANLKINFKNMDELVDRLEENNINVKLFQQLENSKFSILTEKEDALRFYKVLKKDGYSLEINDDLGMISVIGLGIASNNIPRKLTKILNSNEINIDSISSNQTSVSYVISQNNLNNANAIFHRELFE